MTVTAKVKVEKPSPRLEAEMKACPTWSCDASVFDWYYEEPETCLLLAGEVTVTTAGGDPIHFGAGDLVTFPQGMKCTWDVKCTRDVRVPVRKHFRFG